MISKKYIILSLFILFTLPSLIACSLGATCTLSGTNYDCRGVLENCSEAILTPGYSAESSAGCICREDCSDVVGNSLWCPAGVIINGIEDCVKDMESGKTSYGGTCSTQRKSITITSTAPPLSGFFTRFKSYSYFYSRQDSVSYDAYTPATCGDKIDNDPLTSLGTDFGDNKCPDPSHQKVIDAFCSGVSDTAGSDYQEFLTYVSDDYPDKFDCYEWTSRATASVVSQTGGINIGSFEGWPVPTDYADATPTCSFPCIPSCHDSIDNDYDGLVDCADNLGRLNCQFMDPTCGFKTATETEENRQEFYNTGETEGYTQCELTGTVMIYDDTDTLVYAAPVEPEICDDGWDNDCDLLADCDDSDCSEDPYCIGETGNEICDIYCADEDGDGLFNEDCIEECDTGWDMDCDNQIRSETDETCTGVGNNEICDQECTDEDGDGLYNEGCEEVFDDGWDNDCDGHTDTDDPEYPPENPNNNPQPEICNDSIDNDNDGDIDCQDADCTCNINCDSHCIIYPGCCDREHCQSYPECSAQEGNEDCYNGKDDDNDGLIDCYDNDCCYLEECSENPVCSSFENEICNNGIDDDSDTLIDCYDTDDCCSKACCAEHSNCTDSTFPPSNPPSEVYPKGEDKYLGLKITHISGPSLYTYNQDLQLSIKVRNDKTYSQLYAIEYYLINGLNGTQQLLNYGYGALAPGEEDSLTITFTANQVQAWPDGKSKAIKANLYAIEDSSLRKTFDNEFWFALGPQNIEIVQETNSTVIAILLIVIIYVIYTQTKEKPKKTKKKIEKKKKKATKKQKTKPKKRKK